MGGPLSGIEYHPFVIIWFFRGTIKHNMVAQFSVEAKYRVLTNVIS